MHNSHNEKYDDITGILLAGGKSRRMGVDKALIEIDGKTMFANSLMLLRQYFKTVMIAGDRPDLAANDLLTIPDIYPGSALGGLYTGLCSAKTSWVFVMPCDMPYPDARILKLLVECRHGYDAIVPLTPEGFEPVFALYHKRCLPLMETMLQRGQYRIYDIYQYVKVNFLDWHHLPNGWQRSLLDLNTPEQLARIRKDQE